MKALAVGAALLLSGCAPLSGADLRGVQAACKHFGGVGFITPHLGSPSSKIPVTCKDGTEMHVKRKEPTND